MQEEEERNEGRKMKSSPLGRNWDVDGDGDGNGNGKEHPHYVQSMQQRLKLLLLFSFFPFFFLSLSSCRPLFPFDRSSLFFVSSLAFPSSCMVPMPGSPFQHGQGQGPGQG